MPCDPSRGRLHPDGTNEALLLFGGVRLIETLLHTARLPFPEVAIVAKDLAGYADLGLPVWCDRIPEREALGGPAGAGGGGAAGGTH